MASKAAYYEGLQYASKDVEPVNFGAFALGIAQVEKEKFEREEQKRKERDAFQMDIYKNFGDVIYPAFDKTGLQNADIYQTGLAQMISARSQDLNDRFNNNEINQVQYTREMAKLKGQAQQFRSNFESIGKFVEDYRAMGDDVDPSTQDTMGLLNQLFQDSKPYVNEDNLIGNFSVGKTEDGQPRVESFLWDKVASRLQVNKKYDQFEIPKQILGVQGELSKYVAADAVIKTHLTEGGKLKDGTINLIREQIQTLSDNQLMSYARQMGLTEKDGASWNPKDLTELENRALLEEKIAKDQEEKTLALLQQKEATDELAKRELDIKLQDSYLRQKKMSSEERARRGYNYAYYNEESAKEAGIGLTGDVEEFTATKPIPIKQIPLTDLKLEGQLSSEAGENGTIQQLHRNGNGEYVVTIGYTQKQPDGRDGTVQVPQVAKLFLTTRAQKNYFLTMLDPSIGVISDPAPKQGEAKKEDPLGLDL